MAKLNLHWNETTGLVWIDVQEPDGDGVWHWTFIVGTSLLLAEDSIPPSCRAEWKRLVAENHDLLNDERAELEAEREADRKCDRKREEGL